MTIFALGTGVRPFSEDKGIGAAQIAVSGQRPLCPESLGRLDAKNTESLYHIVEAMWMQDPTARTSAILVVSALKRVD